MTQITVAIWEEGELFHATDPTRPGTKATGATEMEALQGLCDERAWFDQEQTRLSRMPGRPLVIRGGPKIIRRCTS